MKSQNDSILLALRHIIQEVSTKNSFEVAISILVERIENVTKSDCCSLYLYDQKRKVLRLAATEGLQKGSIGKASLQLGEGLVGLVGQKQELLNLADAPNHPNFKYLPDVGEDEFQSFLGVPVINQGELLGVLVIQCKENRQFSSDEESFLITLSAQIASIIFVNRANKDQLEENVKRIKGKTGSGSIAIAQAAVWRPPVAYENLQTMYDEDKDLQVELFHQTLFQLQTEMDIAALNMRENSLDKAESGYMSGYGKMLDDQSFQDDVDNEIYAHSYVAASAIKVVTQKRINETKRNNDIDKIRDIRDFAQIMIARLVNVHTKETIPQQQVILVVKTLPAAMVAELPRDKVLGFVCVDSSTSSHTAILARDFGIPAVIGVNLDLNDIDGRTIIVDGQNAEILVDPSQSVIEEYSQLVSQSKEQAALFEQEKFEKGVTLDGKRITIQLNAGLNHEDDDLAAQTDGIGLYRTEISFMLSQTLPTEEQQKQWYRTLLSQFKGLPVCMRTLDVGGDKQLPYLPIEETNPALGWRGIRICIDQPNILKTQLRAMIYAQKDFGNLEIMVPMITRLSEVKFVKRLLDEVIHEVEAETNTTIKRPRFGVMIEVPGIAFIFDEIAKEVDFFSIGSNDLLQYMFAADRNNPKVSKFHAPFFPATVRALKFFIDKANSFNKPISVCGELAGNPLGALLLLSLGYENFSMNYSQIAKVKFITKRVSIDELEQLAQIALTKTSTDEIKNMYVEYAKNHGLSKVIAKNNVLKEDNNN